MCYLVTATIGTDEISVIYGTVCVLSADNLGSLILNGPNLKDQERCESQVCLTASQVIVYNFKKHPPPSWMQSLGMFFDRNHPCQFSMCIKQINQMEFSISNFRNVCLSSLKSCLSEAHSNEEMWIELAFERKTISVALNMAWMCRDKGLSTTFDQPLYTLAVEMANCLW